MKNNNSAVIRALARRGLRSHRSQHAFVVAAIALTTFMIAAVLSVGMSVLETVRLQQTRLEGSVSHAAFGYPTEDQLARLRTLDYVESVGVGRYVATVRTTPRLGTMAVRLAQLDETLLTDVHLPAWSGVVGSYPQQADEVMISRWLLQKLGIAEPETGMPIRLSVVDDRQVVHDEVFTLSGYYTSYEHLRSAESGLVLVSEALAEEYGGSVRDTGSVNILFTDDDHIDEDVERLRDDLGVTDDQSLTISPVFDVDYTEHWPTIVAMAVMLVGLLFTGYLLIDNVLYISVSRDVRFYGLLRALGATPRQVRGVVVGQVARLSLVGVPVGALLAAAVSFLVVPMLVASSGVETGAVVSFSPVVYLAASCFAVLTAMVATLTPAGRAARVSPVEAVRYQGEATPARATRSSARGRPSRLAVRNVLRERRRAVVVLASLSASLIAFGTVTTLVSSIDVERYAESLVDSDVVLLNEALITRADRGQTMDEAVLSQIRALPEVQQVRVMTHEWGIVRYVPEDFDSYLDAFLADNDLLTREQLEESFTAVVHGVDRQAVAELGDELAGPIDLDAFDRGEFALIATDDPGLLAGVDAVDVTFYPGGGTSRLPVGGFVPGSFRQAAHSIAPTLVVSNAFLARFAEDPLVYSVHLDVADGGDEQVLTALDEIVVDRSDASVTSRAEARQGMRDAKEILLLLGGGMSAVLGIIGLLNFVNVMSVGVLARRRELSTMEAVGMSRRQVHRMVVHEGLIYGVVTLMIVATAGHAVMLGVYALLSRRVDYAVLTYPTVPMLAVASAVLVICAVVPEIAYRSISRRTIVERLREAP